MTTGAATCKSCVEKRKNVRAYAKVVIVLLAASVFTTITPLNASATITDPSATMNLWSPHSDSGNDGTPISTFTFSADAAASVGLQRLEWDFDGDGIVDATSEISGAPTSASGISTSHVYGADNVYWPQVRAVDMNNNMSEWNRYDVSGTDVPLDVFWPAPVITMLQWQPFTPDVGQPITFFG
jgi:hypothetical protein